MSAETIIKWLGRAFGMASSALSFYASGMWSFEPQWSPDWHLFALLFSVSLLSGFGGYFTGWLAGYRFSRRRQL